MKKVVIERTLFIILAIIGIILTVQISSAMAQTNKDYKTELTILTDSQIQLVSGHSSKDVLSIYQHLSLNQVEGSYQDAFDNV